MPKNNKIVNPKREPVNVIALIPARGGQQSIKYKNLSMLGKKSLLQWAIETAHASKKIDAVIVSTEDKKIAREAKKFGALVAPRPVEFAQPTSGDAGFYTHAVQWIEQEFGWKPEYIVNLRPTTPLRFAEDVDAMIEYIQKSGADGIKSVMHTPVHTYKMWTFAGNANKKIGEAGQMSPILNDDYRKLHGPDQPRQRISEMYPQYWQDGQVDITRRKFILRPECLKYENVFGPNLHGYVLDGRLIADIDSEKDLIRAEKLYKQYLKEKKAQK
jgi:CMP-N-acetylneuraminic acid synthetase